MMATATARPPSSQPKPMSLSDVTVKGSGLPNRYVLHGVEKVGKTSFAAHAPKSIFIETSGETGLDTLIEAGQLPETPHFPEVHRFENLMGAVDMLIREDHEYRTLVVDTLNGAERMCHEMVCRRDFGGDWGEKGFGGWQRGVKVSLAEWRILLSRFDTLRSQKKMSILALCHTQVRSFRNPEGPDYDRYEPCMAKDTWSLTNKWADCILFLNYETFISEKDPAKKGKATSSQSRIMYTERHAAYDAGNRLGLETEIDMGANGQEAWSNFKAALMAAKKGATK